MFRSHQQRASFCWIYHVFSGLLHIDISFAFALLSTKHLFQHPRSAKVGASPFAPVATTFTPIALRMPGSLSCSCSVSYAASIAFARVCSWFHQLCTFLQINAWLHQVLKWNWHRYRKSFWLLNLNIHIRLEISKLQPFHLPKIRFTFIFWKSKVPVNPR
jgi:hypothetical protein